MNQSYWRTSVTNVIVFSGLSRFGLEAISAEQFSDCQQVFGPGHFGGWRLIGVTTAVNIIEFLYSSVLTHAGALLHFYSCGSCFSPIGVQATVRLLENEPNITVQAGHFLPKASHNCHFHEVLWRGTELNLLRSREEPVERFLQRLGLSQSLSQIRGQTSYYMFKLLWRCRKLCIYMIIWLYDYMIIWLYDYMIIHI